MPTQPASAPSCCVRKTCSSSAAAPPVRPSGNLGMNMARGEWVLILDDDSFRPQPLKTLHRHITQPASDAERAARVLYSDFEVLTEDRTQSQLATLSRAPVSIKAHAVANLHVKNFIPNNVLAFHRVVLEGYRVDPHLQSLEDWNFLLSVFDEAAPCHYDGGGAVVHKGLREHRHAAAPRRPPTTALWWSTCRTSATAGARRRKRSAASARRRCRPPGSRCR